MNSRTSLIALAVVLSLVFVWAVFTPEKDLAKRISNKLESQKQRSDLSMKEAVFSEIAGGVKFWEIRAESSHINNSTQKAELDRIHGIFFKDGKPSLNIIAPKVFWDMKKKSIEVFSPLGYEGISRFETASLVWSLDDKKIYAKDRLSFERDNVAISAGSMSSDTEMEKMVLEKEPVAVMKNKGVPDIEVRASSFEVNAKSGKIYARGSARISRGELSVKSDELVFEQKTNTILASGNPAINYKDIRARSASALYNINKEKVSLKGSVLLRRKDSELKGESVTVDLRDESISIKGRKSTVLIEEELIGSGKQQAGKEEK